MRNLLSRVRWFFTGVRLIFPLVPRFVWVAFRRMITSIADYWKESQSVVNEIADYYTDETVQKLTTEYDSYVFWICFAVASFLYLVGWLVQAWLTVEGLRLVVSAIFRVLG